MKNFWSHLTDRLWGRWLLALFLSILLHFSTFWGLQNPPRAGKRHHYKIVRFRIIPPQPKEEKKLPPPPKPRKKRPKLKKRRPKRRFKPRKRRRKKRKRRKKIIKRPLPPPNQKAPIRRPPPPNAPLPRPVFGLTMSSLGKGKGAKVAMRVGNTLMKEPEKRVVPPEKVRPYVAPSRPQPPKERFEPIPIYEVDQNPREWIKARAAYPPKAKSLGLEARVTLSVEIKRNGFVRRVKVISVQPPSSRGYGFGRAARQALRKFRFHPARYKGYPVDVIVRYIYRFELED